jgi:hypothetical protein
MAVIPFALTSMHGANGLMSRVVKLPAKKGEREWLGGHGVKNSALGGTSLRHTDKGDQAHPLTRTNCCEKQMTFVRRTHNLFILSWDIHRTHLKNHLKTANDREPQIFSQTRPSDH